MRSEVGLRQVVYRWSALSRKPINKLRRYNSIYRTPVFCFFSLLYFLSRLRCGACLCESCNLYFFRSSSASQFRMCSARNYLFSSHRAILYVMFTCNCVFIAALILFLLNVFSFNSNRICFRCSRGLVSFCCLFSSS